MNVTEIKPIDIILPLKVEKYYDNDNNDDKKNKTKDWALVQTAALVLEV